MSYIPESDTPPVSPDTVQTLARLAGFSLPAEDVESLARALADHLASVATLDTLDLTDVDPILQFDPRWHD